MGQYSSKTAVSLLAPNKTTYCGVDGREKNIVKRSRKIKSAIFCRGSKSNAIEIPGSSSTPVSNRITTINLHIENNGGLSTTKSSQEITKTIQSELDKSCEAHYCECSHSNSNSPRQLIIKIQLSKMEQTNAECENITSNQQFECCDINHNIMEQSACHIGESQHTLNKSSVSVYVANKLTNQDCLNESSTSSKLHSKSDINASSSANSTSNEQTQTKLIENNLATIRAPTAHSQVDFVHHLVPDLDRIINSTYYWGKMDRYEAERLLEDKEEGTFLLRDSAQDDFLFSVTFRKYGLSLHARIEQSGNQFSFDCHDPSCICAPTITQLLEHYKDPSCVMFFEPRLTIPLNRPNPFSLQELCRAKIVSNTTYDGINQLELPCKLKTFLKEFHYKQKLCTRSLESNRNNN